MPGITLSTQSEGWDRQKGPCFSSPLLTRLWSLLQWGSLPFSVYPEVPLKSSNTCMLRPTQPACSHRSTLADPLQVPERLGRYHRGWRGGQHWGSSSSKADRLTQDVMLRGATHWIIYPRTALNPSSVWDPTSQPSPEDCWGPPCAHVYPLNQTQEPKLWLQRITKATEGSSWAENSAEGWFVAPRAWKCRWASVRPQMLPAGHGVGHAWLRDAGLSS